MFVSHDIDSRGIALCTPKVHIKNFYKGKKVKPSKDSDDIRTSNVC